MGAFEVVLDCLLDFPLGKILVEVILVLGLMCILTDGIAQVRNTGDKNTLEVPGGTEKKATAIVEENSVQWSFESKDQQIASSDRSNITEANNLSNNIDRCRLNDLQEAAPVAYMYFVTDDATTTPQVPESNLEPLSEPPDHLTLRLVQDASNCNTSECCQSCFKNDINNNSLTQRSPTQSHQTSTDNKQITGDYISAYRMNDGAQIDWEKSSESWSNTPVDRDLYLTEESPTVDKRPTLQSSILKLEEMKRGVRPTDGIRQSVSSSHMGVRPETEGSSCQEMLSEQMEFLMQDRDSFRLWNEMILDDNARLNSENTRLRLENREVIRENDRLTKISASLTKNPLKLTTRIPMSQENKHRTPLHFQIVFVGDSGVGKTSFIHRVCEEKFSPRFNSTVGFDFQSKTLDINGRLVALRMWDTAGQERFRSMTRQYFRKADGAIVMYDVTGDNSFRNVRSWIQSAQDGSGDATVFAIIGNKRDLVDNDATSRQVTTTDGAELAKEFNAVFYETSAKNDENFDESLLAVVSLLIERKKKLDRNSISTQLSIVRLDKNLQLSARRNCCGTNLQPST